MSHNSTPVQDMYALSTILKIMVKSLTKSFFSNQQLTLTFVYLLTLLIFSHLQP
jgi:hypothetical protein